MLRHLLRRRRSPQPRWAASTAVILAFFAAGTTLAWAAVHIRLESSVPSDQEVLVAAPERFELRFSGPVNEALSSLVLVTPSSDSLRIAIGTPSDDDRILVGDAPRLASGEYLVLWSTVSADGHPVSGEFGFTVARETSDAAFGDVDPADRAAPFDSGEAAKPAQTAAAPAKAGPPAAVVLLAGLGMFCLLGFAGLLWFCGSAPLMGEPRVGLAIAALGWIALLLLAADLAAWTFGVLPPGSGLAGFTAAFGSLTGGARLGRLALVAIAVFATPRHGRAAAALALSAVAVGAVSGHAAVLSPWITIPAKALHMAAAAIWLGGLMLVVLAPDRPTARSDDWQYGAVVRTVSGVALLAVVLIAASGIVQSALFVGDFGAYAGTPYGRGVLAKWAGLALLVGFGAFHRLRTLPTLASGGHSRGLRRTIRLETIVMLAVLLVAAWLARVPAPASY